MSFGTDIAEVALDVLTEFGRTVAYTQVVNGAYNSATSSFSRTTSLISVKAVIEEVTDVGKDAALVAISTKKMTAAAMSFSTPPTVVDTVAFDGLSFAINDIDTIYAAEDVAVYVFYLRKG